jgi:hypothetical protein
MAFQENASGTFQKNIDTYHTLLSVVIGRHEKSESDNTKTRQGCKIICSKYTTSKDPTHRGQIIMLKWLQKHVMEK